MRSWRPSLVTIVKMPPVAIAEEEWWYILARIIRLKKKLIDAHPAGLSVDLYTHAMFFSTLFGALGGFVVAIILLIALLLWALSGPSARMHVQRMGMVAPQGYKSVKWATLEHPRELVTIGTIERDGNLRALQASVEAKEQGWGSQCTALSVGVYRGDKLIAMSKQAHLGRTKEFKKFALELDKGLPLKVKKGDIVRLGLHAQGKGCQVWTNGVHVEAHIFG
jgi:hypothetical protein